METLTNRTFIKDIALDGGMCLLILAALPILAALGLALRGVLVGLVVAGAVSCALLYPVSRRFRDWFREKAEIEFRHRGLRLARDVMLHPAHSWARWGRETVTVGADDLLLSSLGPVEAADLPERGMHVERSRPLFRLHSDGREVEVLSPLSGFVNASNTVLKVCPEIMNDLPFSEGWAVQLTPDDEPGASESLLRARRAQAWFSRDVDRAISLTGLNACPAEGQLYRSVDRAVWKAISPMFARECGEDTAFDLAKY